VPLQDADVKEITGRMDIMIRLMAALFAREFSNIDAIVKLENMKLSREQIASSWDHHSERSTAVVHGEQEGEENRRANRRSGTFKRCFIRRCGGGQTVTTDEALTIIAQQNKTLTSQNEMLIFLAARLVWKPEELVEVVMANKKKDPRRT